jgi:hypothetical protein
LSSTFRQDDSPLSLVSKIRLALRVWRRYLFVRRAVSRTPLPELTRELAEATAPRRRHSPYLLSHAVGRVLRIGHYQPRCLISALVLYRLLREQGDEAVLVIGLPAEARDHKAHAWVELDGRDVGPPPGKGRHAEFAHYP